jgi:hypothetical protein
MVILFPFHILLLIFLIFYFKVGPNAAVIIYCTNRESAIEFVDHRTKQQDIYSNTASQQFNNTNPNPLNLNASINSNNPLLRSAGPSLQASLDFSMTGRSDIQYSVLDSQNNTLTTQNNYLLKNATNQMMENYSATNPLLSSASKPNMLSTIESTPTSRGNSRANSILKQSADTSNELDEKANRAAKAK